MTWVEDTTSVVNTLEYIEKSLFIYSHNLRLPLVIIYNGKIAGTVGFISLDTQQRQAEIGYWLGQEFTGKGIMHQCVKTLLNYGFNELDLHRIQIRCSEKNVASQNVAKKAGFIQEAILKDDHMIDDKFEDTIVFRMLNN